MSESATHNRPRFLSGAEIDWENSHAGNVLLDRTAISFGGGEFDSRFSTTGGEDTFFFASAKRMGAKLIWCDEAVVIEDVSPARMTLAWALRRSYKGGQTWVRVRTEFSMWLWPVMVLRGALSAFLAIAMLLPSLLISRGMAVRQAQRVAAGFGKMTAWWPLGGRRNGHYIG
jgi:succinoglycan biosynthesis protein ExoM